MFEHIYFCYKKVWPYASILLVLTLCDLLLKTPISLTIFLLRDIDYMLIVVSAYVAYLWNSDLRNEQGASYVSTISPSSRHILVVQHLVPALLIFFPILLFVWRGPLAEVSPGALIKSALLAVTLTGFGFVSWKQIKVFIFLTLLCLLLWDLRPNNSILVIATLFFSLYLSVKTHFWPRIKLRFLIWNLAIYALTMLVANQNMKGSIWSIESEYEMKPLMQKVSVILGPNHSELLPSSDQTRSITYHSADIFNQEDFVKKMRQSRIEDKPELLIAWMNSETNPTKDAVAEAEEFIFKSYSASHKQSGETQIIACVELCTRLAAYVAEHFVGEKINALGKRHLDLLYDNDHGIKLDYLFQLAAYSFINRYRITINDTEMGENKVVIVERTINKLKRGEGGVDVKGFKGLKGNYSYNFKSFVMDQLHLEDAID